MTAAEAPNTTERAPRVWPLPVKAYHALSELGLIPEKTELLHGQVIQKMSKSPYHSYLQQFLAEAISRALAAGTYLRVEQPITCVDSELEPYLAVVRGSKEDYRREHPQSAELVIEVCVSSHEYDRSKLRAYATAGIKEVWLVLAPEKQVETYSRPTGDRYAERSTCPLGERLTSVVVPGFSVVLGKLFAD